MNPQFKVTLLQFMNSQLASRFCAEVDKLVRLHTTQSAVRWFYGHRTIGLVLQAVHTKVSFVPNDTVNSIFLKSIHGLREVIADTEKELILERMRQTIKAITAIKMSPALSPRNLHSHKLLILDRLQKSHHEIALLKNQFATLRHGLYTEIV